MSRPKLDFVTIDRLWRPSWAQQMIEMFDISNNGDLKPSQIKFIHRPDTTEPEKYTMALIRLICDVGFGATARNYPAQKQIWNANAAWVRYHVSIGKGLNYIELANLAGLYSKHVREDIDQLSH